jgi:hypothetical protein
MAVVVVVAAMELVGIAVLVVVAKISLVAARGEVRRGAAAKVTFLLFLFIPTPDITAFPIFFAGVRK